MTSFGTTIAIAIIAAGVLPALILWHRMEDSLKMDIQTWIDDPDSAVQAFITVVSAAKSSLIVHGEMRRSLYENDAAINAVRRQLETQDDFQVQFLFNKWAKPKMTKELRAEFPGRVAVKYKRIGMSPENNLQYEIADGGVAGHISGTENGVHKRLSKLFDCSRNNPRTRKRVFGEHIEQFERDFESGWVCG